MATLIAVYNSEGCIGRCDAKCYNAVSDKCTCVCGGANHGVGLARAAEQTETYVEMWLKEYQESHPDMARADVFMPKAVQVPLFD